ncbi:hypothetical protein [Microbacterium testaceum]|nr:hypothetical protein [Microbacterium testaceum]
MRAALLDRRAQPVKNHSPNPALQVSDVNIGPLGASTPVTTAFSSSFLPAPAGAVTYTSTADGAMGRRWNQNNPLTVGDVVRFAFWITTSVSTSISPYIEYTGPRATYAGGGFAAGTITVPANVRTRITGMAVAPKPASVDLVALRTTGFISSAETAGASIKLEAHMVTINQPLPEVHCDGNTPGWKLLGTVGLSPAIGWPYTLDSVAGKPMASIEGDGVQAAISGQPFDPFSVYWVYDAYAPAAEWTEPFGVLGNANAAAWPTMWANQGALSFGRRNLSDYTYAHSRLGTGPSPLDNRNGISPTRMNETRAWEVGCHVVARAMTFPGGTDASLLTMIDGKIDHVMTYAGGAGIGIAPALIRARTPSASANLPTPVNTNALAIRGLFYAANHDRTTRLAVARWLANRYGTPLAA